MLSISLPVSVCQLAGLVISGSAIETAHIDLANRFFRLSRDFLVSFDETYLARYFGHQTEVAIGRLGEAVSAECFSEIDCISSVRFASDCRVSILGEVAFSRCPSLQSISIPSWVETIAKACFMDSGQLPNAPFAPRCRISCLSESAFERCYTPGPIETIRLRVSAVANTLRR
jgi:hypothetical protein